MTSFNLALRQPVNKRWRGRGGKHGEHKGEALSCVLNGSGGSQQRSGASSYSAAPVITTPKLIRQPDVREYTKSLRGNMEGGAQVDGGLFGVIKRKR